MIFAGFLRAARALRVLSARRSDLHVRKMMRSISEAFGSGVRLFAHIFGAELRRFRSKNDENRAILRLFWRGFGAPNTRIDRQKHSVIAGSRCMPCRAHNFQRFERAVRSARKIHKKLHENRTCSRWFLQSFCARHARCECATQAEVVFDVLKML